MQLGHGKASILGLAGRDHQLDLGLPHDNPAAADLGGLVRIVKRKLKMIRYRPHLINGCLAGIGLKIETW